MRLRSNTTALLLSILAGSAHAHAFLLRADPAVGAAVSTSPKTLRLEFSDTLVLPFCGVDVASQSGSPLKVGKVRFADSTNKSLAVDLPALQPGNYRVTWHVVSSDTHRTEGDFAFSLK